MAGASNPGNSQKLAGKIAYVVIFGIGIGPALMSGLEAQGARAIWQI